MPPKRKGPPVEDASQQAFDHVVAGKTIKEAMDLTGLPAEKESALRRRVQRRPKASTSATPAKKKKRQAKSAPVSKGVPKSGAKLNPVQAGKLRIQKHKEKEIRKEAHKHASLTFMLL